MLPRGKKRYRKRNEKQDPNDCYHSYDNYRFTNILIPKFGSYKKAMIVTCAVFICILLFRSHVIGREIISGSSMEDTLFDGDICWSQKIFWEKNLQRYDIVIAKLRHKMVVKRIIGIPGDHLEIRNNQVYINGKKINEKYRKETEFAGKGRSIILKKDEYFLIGDNRRISYDSRNYGSVKKEEIKGILRFRIYPFNRIGPINE